MSEEERDILYIPQWTQRRFLFLFLCNKFVYLFNFFVFRNLSAQSMNDLEDLMLKGV